MVAATRSGIGGQESLVRCLASPSKVGIERFSEVVAVDEVVAGVVRGVDVDHLDAAGVGFLEEFEDFEVLAFDEDVAGGVFVDALAGNWDEGAFAGDGGEAAGFAFAGPGEAEVFGGGKRTSR